MWLTRDAWLMAQTWSDLLFAHWPVPPDALAPVVREPLRLDTFDGNAWLGVVAFQLSRIHLRGLPPLYGVRGFPEVNLRTYVRCGDRPGVLEDIAGGAAVGTRIGGKP